MANILIETGAKIVFAVVSALLSIAVTWVCAKIGNNEKLKSIAYAKNELIRAAEETVGELEQTTVATLKAANEDGHLSKTDVEYLGKLLIEKVVAKMSAPSAEVLQAAGCDIVEMIHGAAESFITEMKANAAEAPAEE